MRAQYQLSTSCSSCSSSLPRSSGPGRSDSRLLFVIYHPTSLVGRRFLQRCRLLEDRPVDGVHHARGRGGSSGSRGTGLPDDLGMLQRRLFHGLPVPLSRRHPHLHLPLALITGSLQEPLFTLLDGIPEGGGRTGLVARRKGYGRGFLDLEELLESLLTEDERLEQRQRVGERPVERQCLTEPVAMKCGQHGIAFRPDQ